MPFENNQRVIYWQSSEPPRKFPEPAGVGASGKILRTSEVCNRYSNKQQYTGRATI
jgi:hypothetical protein